jgi:hypothetical protein
VQAAPSTVLQLSQALSWIVAVSKEWPLITSLAALALLVSRHWLMAEIGEFFVEPVWNFVKPFTLSVMKKISGILVKFKWSRRYLAK